MNCFIYESDEWRALTTTAAQLKFWLAEHKALAVRTFKGRVQVDLREYYTVGF